ncbi:MAG: hypothetical protein ABI889_11645 [Gemmatimonadota bacterium]
MNDEELRREYQRSPKVAPATAHPQPEQLERIVNGEGSEDERLLLLEHVLQCPTCGPELDLLRTASEGACVAERPVMGARWLALAAAALLLIGIDTLALHDRRGAPPADVLRGSSQSVSFIEPSAGASIARPLRLAWHRLDGATSYRVELLSTAGELIGSWNTADTTMAIPDSLHVSANTPLDVWVRATLADRTEVSSPIVRFTVKK